MADRNARLGKSCMSTLTRSCGHTVNYPPLFMDDAVAEAVVALKAAHGSLLVPDEVVFEQCTRLYGCVLHLQLMDLAQQAKNLPLLFRADAPRQGLLQPVPTLPDFPEPSLQLCLAHGHRICAVRPLQAANHSIPSMLQCPYACTLGSLPISTNTSHPCDLRYLLLVKFILLPQEGGNMFSS